MSKRKGKAMSNLPKHYIDAMEELQEENNKLRTELEKIRDKVKKLNIDDVSKCYQCNSKDTEVVLMCTDCGATAEINE